MKIHVVRHGRTTANQSGLLLGRADPDLDDLGAAQAQAAAKMLGALGSVGRVISSPLARTRQTADAIAAACGTDGGLCVDIEPAFIELDYGEWDLRPLRDVPVETWKRWRSDASFAPPGGESLHDLGQRVAHGLDALTASMADTVPDADVDGDDQVRNDVVIVTHVSPVKAAVAWALGTDQSVAWRMFVEPASITQIAIGGHAPSLLGFNDTSHLPQP